MRNTKIILVLIALVVVGSVSALTNMSGVVGKNINVPEAKSGYFYNLKARNAIGYTEFPQTRSSVVQKSCYIEDVSPGKILFNRYELIKTHRVMQLASAAYNPKNLWMNN